MIANLVTVTLGAHGGQGWVNIYNALGSVNVVVDVEGYFTPQPVERLSRALPSDRAQSGSATRARPATRAARTGHSDRGTSMVVNVARAGGVPSDGTAEAAVVNLTGVAGTASTYPQPLPDQRRTASAVPPGTSTLNLLPGRWRRTGSWSSSARRALGGADDALCVYNAVGSDQRARRRQRLVRERDGDRRRRPATSTRRSHRPGSATPASHRRRACTGTPSAPADQRLITVAGTAACPQSQARPSWWRSSPT